MKKMLEAILGPALEGVLRFIPDKNARAEAKELFDNNVLNAITSLVQGQLAINQQEAKHSSIFVAGWRPGVGWVCVVALGWNYVLQPIVAWIAVAFGFDLAKAPELDTGELVTILLGMLGLGGLRTYEKRLGVARSKV